MKSVPNSASRGGAKAAVGTAPLPACESAQLTSQWDEPRNQGSLEFERVILVEPTADQLRRYAGEYFSGELSATYRFVVRDGHLWLRVNSRRWERLDLTTRDQFIPSGPAPHGHRLITFLRDDKSEVNGLSIDYGRVKGVHFAKR